MGFFNPGTLSRVSADIARSSGTMSSAGSSSISGGVAGAQVPQDQIYSGSDTAWQALCTRVLPLFNGEGLKGCMEDLNDLVRWVNLVLHPGDSMAMLTRVYFDAF
jgi:hypothetical protein